MLAINKSSNIRDFGNPIPQLIRNEIRSIEEEKYFSSFYGRLFVNHSNLTRNERIISGFIKLDLSSSKIAKISDVTTTAVEVARTRLRKKLGLTNVKISLFEYLNSI